MIGGAASKPSKFNALRPWLREVQRRQKKTASEGLKPLAEPLNRGAAGAAQVALPQSPILRRSEAIPADGPEAGERKERRKAPIRF